MAGHKDTATHQHQNPGWPDTLKIVAAWELMIWKWNGKLKSVANDPHILV
jgi:hypothetical protein